MKLVKKVELGASRTCEERLIHYVLSRLVCFLSQICDGNNQAAKARKMNQRLSLQGNISICKHDNFEVVAYL
jgi:hypothetical protein